MNGVVVATAAGVPGPVFQRLPFEPDAGFPQAFRLALGERTYLFSAYVNVTDDGLLDSAQPLVLPRPHAFLVMDVVREGGAGPVVLLHRKVVPGLVYGAGELVVTVPTVAVHPLNINGSGAFGSQLVGGVAVRWAS